MFHILADTLRPLMNIMLGKEWLQLEKLPRDTGFIICPNHCTEIDPILVGQMLYSNGLPPHFLTKASLFKIPVVGKVLAGSLQIPVDRAGPTARRSLEVAQEVLDQRGAIVIYPEGTLTRDPDLWPMKGHTGAARLALQTGAPVIPVAHWGAQEVFPRYAKMVKLFPRKKVRMIVGDPVDLDEFRDKPQDKQLLDAVTEKILVEITLLLAGLRGEQPPGERWDPSVHNQTSRGRQIDKDSGMNE
ncbi:1-acyl-sn-glycerol-3-phosphate acyltransferase [Psychromicrobium silvestre]|uniref:1-acyl-sn-glycerol-3-phosphate acyltransferase n=1 Tax=Psychromicrobium silvestre TaxID=1645614 RepID=A0A7Y9S6K0_9MICC|nr:lysophospholipid acyltransferase family protein [Psychromicrobium silvestre]NYE94641.1 1-acyl-sn-glycerol-3-phosphate acyltransferase [Psychromicrobium silvestre]